MISPTFLSSLVAILILAGALWALSQPEPAERELIASWYGMECKGRTMANGKRFDPFAMTCASWDYPLGARLLISANGRSVIVTVTDRGPAKKLLRTRQIDLSRAAFEELEDLTEGLVAVKVQRL